MRYPDFLKTLIVLSLLCINGTLPLAAEDARQPPASFFDLTALDIQGKPVDFESFRGKVLLAVNTASYCGFTSQYKGLEELFQRYRDRGFLVLGFPSNDFGEQEPGTNAEIKKFCELRFKTTFPMFEKGSVSGDSRQPVYRFLTEQSAEEFRGDPGWNFVKFLVDRNGKVVGRFSSTTAPSSNELKHAIEAALQEEPPS